LAKHFYKVKIKKIIRETQDCVSIEFDIKDDLWSDFQFKQGQSISIKSDQDGGHRSYSICSSPLEKKLVVAVKRIPNGVFSTYALERLKDGDVLEIMQPGGKFYSEVNPANKKRYIFFAAGSGITPIISIMKTVLATEKESKVQLLYGSKNVQSIIFREELEGLKNKYPDRVNITYVLSREQTDSPINTGRVDVEKLQRLKPLLDYPSADEFFICGPEQMIFSINEYLKNLGIEQNKIHFELFTTPGDSAIKKAEAGAENGNGATKEGSQVTITVDGNTYEVNVPFKKVTILDAGLDQGINLPYSCKGGVCTTCRAKLLEGKVEMDCNYGLEDYEVEQGYILTCQSHPRTEKVKVDYDQ